VNAAREKGGYGVRVEAESDFLDSIEPGEEPIALRHGTVDIARQGGVDVVRVRSATGSIEIELSARGPRLRLQAVDLEIASEGHMSLVAGEISVRSRGNLEIDCGGEMRTTALGGRHTRIDGAERVEADTIEMQSNGGGLALRARDAVAIDGERIGLNSLDLPEPFPWSKVAAEEP
jgi:hypothetical protein